MASEGSRATPVPGQFCFPREEGFALLLQFGYPAGKTVGLSLGGMLRCPRLGQPVETLEEPEYVILRFIGGDGRFDLVEQAGAGGKVGEGGADATMASLQVRYFVTHRLDERVHVHGVAHDSTSVNAHTSANHKATDHNTAANPLTRRRPRGSGAPSTRLRHGQGRG